MDDESPDAQSPRKRRRDDRNSKSGRRRSACQTCRLRKIGCDRLRPVCSFCKSSESQCVYLGDSLNKITLESVAIQLTEHFGDVNRRLDELKASVTSGNGSANLVKSRLVDSNRLVPEQTLNVQHTLPELSRDFSHIPPHKTSADTVLTWPIFDGRYPNNHLIQVFLNSSPPPYASSDRRPNEDDGTYSIAESIAPFEEEQVPSLVDRFLQNVHTKNPILDVETLVLKGRKCVRQGLGWDAWSCLLLLACALGHVAKPFGSTERSDAERPGSDLSSKPRRTEQENLLQAENCFVLACRRLGLLQPTLLATQCHFFAGVYTMYTLRPMFSWQHFHQASVTYQLYLKTHGRLSEDFNIVQLSPSQLTHSHAIKQHRQEQRLYWSCFKSECEFRVELPLPQSELAQYSFPDLFPSPPSPPLSSPNIRNLINGETTGGTNLVSQADSVLSHAVSIDDERSVRDHAKKLCNEEESWYYYLTEVALRRIGNRIINTFFANDKANWINIEPYLDLAVEFEAQVSSWSANLPPAMQRYETNSTIRAPSSVLADGVEAGFVSRELSWATENRLLEMRSWLYQPFLYYLVHARPLGLEESASKEIPLSCLEQGHGNLSSESRRILWTLIKRGIDCNLTILETRSVPHRHHGLWYDLRAIMCSSLILLAVVKSGYIDLIPGGAVTLIGHPTALAHDLPGYVQRETFTSTINHQTLHIHGAYGKVLAQFRLWSIESADMFRQADVLEDLIINIMMSQRTSQSLND